MVNPGLQKFSSLSLPSKLFSCFHSSPSSIETCPEIGFARSSPISVTRQADWADVQAGPVVCLWFIKMATIKPLAVIDVWFGCYLPAWLAE